MPVWQALVYGVVQGLVASLFAAGLLLIYKSSRIINFAHGAIATGTSMLALTMVGGSVADGRLCEATPPGPLPPTLGAGRAGPDAAPAGRRPSGRLSRDHPCIP